MPGRPRSPTSSAPRSARSRATSGSALRAATEVTVAPDIIGDLTLMLAELLENAVSFSPADSPVEVGPAGTDARTAAR